MQEYWQGHSNVRHKKMFFLPQVRLLALAFFFVCLPAPRVFCAEKMVTVTEAAEKAGITVFWDPLSENCILEKNGHYVSFTAGESFALADYAQIIPEDAPVLHNSMLMASSTFFNRVENFFQNAEDTNPFRIGAILIDPGHGGKDPGASATHTINGKKVTVVEKDICLRVGLLLRDYLKRAYPDKLIIMTRDTDVYLTLDERTKIANNVSLPENEAVLYVSIHVNSSLAKEASGYEVWYLSPGYRRQVLNKTVSDDKDVQDILNTMLEEEFTTESIMIANFILAGISAQVGSLSTSRGIKAEEWFVVRNTNMPSVLIETGFLTNAAEAALLTDPDYLQKLSFGIYNGLQAFVAHFERSRGFTVK